MNIQGIEFLRKLGLPGPRKETITKDPTAIDLDDLYAGAVKGATILVLDYSIPINRNPSFGSGNIRRYKIERNEFQLVLEELNEDVVKGILLEIKKLDKSTNES